MNEKIKEASKNISDYIKSLLSDYHSVQDIEKEKKLFLEFWNIAYNSGFVDGQVTISNMVDLNN